MIGSYFVVFIILSQSIASQDISDFDVNSLSEMSLEKLLFVKNSLEDDTKLISSHNEGEGEQMIAAKLDTSQAQALRGQFKPHARGSYETSQKKGSKKGLSTIFQMTITALAFLAFAGYLLCLLVQAIKSKHMMSGTGAMGTPTAATIYIAPIRRRRPIRHRREVLLEPSPDPDMLYYALKTFSEEYASYHTVDYKYYNYTVDSLG